MAKKTRRFKQSKKTAEPKVIKPVTKIAPDEVWQKKIRTYLKGLVSKMNIERKEEN